MKRFLVIGLAGFLLSSAHAEIISLQGEKLVAGFDTTTGRITQLSLTGRSGQVLTTPGIELRTAQQVQVRFITGSWLAPADPSLSQTPWRILHQKADQITVESGLSPVLSLRARQTFAIDRARPVLRIRTVLTRTSRNPFPVQCWLIVPAPLPDFFLLDTAPIWRGTRHEWTELSNPGSLDRATVQPSASTIRFSPPQNAPHPKVGTLGRWVAGIYRDHILVLVTKPSPSGSYPDGSSVQAYAEGVRAELETVSPNYHLKPSDRLTSESALWVLARDPAVSQDRLPAWIDRQLSSYR